MRLIVLLATLLSCSSKENQTEISISEISIEYGSTFSPLPELYQIHIDDRKILELSSIINSEGKSTSVKSKRIPKKKWRKIISYISSDEFQSLESSDKFGSDGAWYSLTSFYKDGTSKNVKMWSGYAPIELQEFLK